MTDQKTPPQQNHPQSPEAELSAKIADLRTRLAALNLEIRTAKGRLANADPTALRVLEKENEQLRTRETALRKALFGLMTESEKPGNNEENELNVELLRRAAVDYFKKANVAPEIWKNIES